jgi:hypothetical protein
MRSRSRIISNESAEPAELLLIAGEPIGEPVERYGPFVMKPREEVVRDFREGKMGTNFRHMSGSPAWIRKKREVLCFSRHSRL